MKVIFHALAGMLLASFLMRIEFNLFCRLCGEGPNFAKAPLCAYCMAHIECRLISPGWRRLETLPVFSLMSWKNKDSASEKLLYEVKENKGSSLLEPFAEKIVSSVDPRIFTEGVLLPLPSSTGRLHSQLLAQTLSMFTGAATVDPLRLREATRQPGKRKTERMERQMEASPIAVEKLHSYTTVLLIDDVVTTGATMAAARAALRPINRVYGLTLFSRALSTKFASS